METLKNVLISPPILALPYSGGHMTLDTERKSSKGAVSYLKNNWMKQPTQSGIGLVISRMIKSDVTQSNAIASRFYGLSSLYGHT